MYFYIMMIFFIIFLCECNSMLNLIILMELFLFVCITPLMVIYSSEIFSENFILMFVTIMILESCLSLVVSVMLMKKYSNDYLDLKFFI